MNRAIWERRQMQSTPEIAVPAMELRDQVDRIDSPVLLMMGKEDRPEVLESMRYLQRQIVDSSLRFVLGAAHFPNLERPAIFNDAALAFLASAWG